MADIDHIERWKPIKGYEGRYEVSDRGRVRSLSFNHTGRPGMLKLAIDRDGYLHAYLCLDGPMKRHTAHSLVLEAFTGPRPPGLVCDHLDSNPSNNHVDNLEWVTYRENIMRGRLPELMRMRCGSKCSYARLTEDQVVKIRARHERYKRGGSTLDALADEFGVSVATIWRIVHRRTWKHV